MNINDLLNKIDIEIARLSSNYKSCESDKTKNNNVPNVSSPKIEEFNNNLQERIAKSHKNVKEQKIKNGIKCDEPVQIISISEIKEAAERARKIEYAKAKAKEKKELLQKQQEDDMKVVTEATKKFDKLELRKTVKYSKRTPTVMEDKKKLPWYATIPVVGAIAISAISRVATTEKTGLDETTPSSNITKSDITTTITDNTKKQNQTTTTQNEGEEKDDKTEKSIVINIGDKIKVSDGTEYTANCLGGGNSNKIGEVSWRPATDYSVDKVAFCYDGMILGVMSTGEGDVKQTLNKYATQYEIDVNQINTSVLLSLVPGSGDTGWAQISIDDMEKNISKPIQDLDSKVQTHESSEIDR